MAHHQASSLQGLLNAATISPVIKAIQFSGKTLFITAGISGLYFLTEPVACMYLVASIKVVFQIFFSLAFR